MYDLTDFEQDFAERDRQLADLRANEPVAWDDTNGWWYVTTHADITTVSRDTTTFSSAQGVTWFADIPIGMITEDPPEHTRLRRLVSKQFTPRMVNQLRDLARERAERGIDELIADGGGDFVEKVAVPVTLSVIMKMLGIGVERMDEIRTWSDDMMGGPGRLHDPGVMERTMAAAQAWRAHVDGHLEEKLRNPTDDLLSMIATDPEEPLSHEDLHRFAMLLIVAGNETTRHTSTSGISYFHENPEQLAALRTDPELLPGAVQEVLRFSSVVRSMTRTVTADVELNGSQLRAGDRVQLVYPSANRDADVFDDPFAFDVTRDPNPQIAFGIGTHYCLGANLAQLQLDVIFRAFLDRVQDYRVVEAAQFHTALVTGMERLEIEIAA
ncbi:MAG: cytochrome P450 [Actinomycetota bacterium]